MAPRTTVAAAVALALRCAHAARACHSYQGDLGDGANIGSVRAAQTPAECGSLCLAEPGCTAYTFTVPGGAACYLHPTPGTGVDSGSAYVSGVCGDDDATFGDPLALADAPGLSGVPLGGIGVGFFDLAPDGGVARVAINNAHQDGVITDANATFLAVFRASAGGAHSLQRRPAVASGPALPPATHTVATALFPRINVTVDGGRGSPPVRVRAWSPLVPHDVSNSSLPLAFVDVVLSNAGGAAPDVVSVAFSWQDVIARRMFDATTAQLDAYYPKDGRACGFATDALRNAMAQAGVDVPNSLPRVPTTAAPLAVGGLVGFEQRSAPLRPNVATLQHYVHRVAVLVEAGAGDEVTFAPAYAAAPAAAAAAWAPFAATGAFASAAMPPGGAPLHAIGGPEMATALALRATVPAGGERVVRFVVAWWAEDDAGGGAPPADNRTRCGTGDYGKYYHRSFSSLEALIAAAVAGRPALAAATAAVGDAVVASSVPRWLAFKVVNSAYTLFTNAILNRGDRFSMMEGGMGGLAGTMDQRMVAHILYHKLFPGLDAAELAQFGSAQDASGYIDHFDANLYAGITGPDGATASPLGGQQYTDNTIGYLYQVAKAYTVTADAALLALHAPRVARAVAFLATQRASPAFPHLISGSNTYDDFYELPLNAYMNSAYTLALEACRVLAAASGDAALAATCARDRDAVAAEAVASLFVPAGGYFAYGAQLDGSGRADAILFGGQAAGSFLGRHAGWGDIGAPFNLTASALAAQLARQVAPSLGFYAPKVFNLTSGSRALDPRNGAPSSTWPFYLESYTALAAMQAGFVDDGLALLDAIQRVNLRIGLAWCQNLWNPGFITYVAAPVSWFALDVLAGAGLDAVAGVLALSPLVRPNDTAAVSLPVFFPQAWAVVDAQRAPAGGPGGTLRFTVTRVFADVAGGAPVAVRAVSAAPLGTPASAPRVVTLADPFVFAPGAVLDLSPHFDELVAPALRPRVLPAAPP